MSQAISYSTDFTSRLEAINKMLSTMAYRDTKFLSMFLDLSNPVDSYLWEWSDKTLVGFKDVLTTALTSTTTTTITVASNSNLPKRYIDGTTNIRIDGEYMLVTSTITVTTTLSSYNVTRAQKGTTAATHVANSQILIVDAHRVEGFTAGRDDSQRSSRKFNYTQIFERQLILTGTSQHVKAVGDEMKLNKQAMDLTKELLVELQMSLIHGLRYTPNSNNPTDRAFGGFYYWATQGGGTSTAAGGNSLDTTLIDDVIEAYLNKGGDANNLTLAVPIKQQRKLNDLKAARIVGGGQTQKEMGINNFVETYDFGSRAHVTVIPVVDLADDEVYFFDKSLIKVKPLQGRTWDRQPLAKTGDSEKELIVGEYTAEFRNVQETLYRYSGLATL
jgi:hypothetical protein